MKILVQTEWYDDDPDEPHLVRLSMDGEVVLEGDGSHDEIFVQIEGFIAALNGLTIPFNLKVVQIEDNDDDVDFPKS